MAIERIVIVHRQGADPMSDFYPWLAQMRAGRQEVTRLTLLRPDAPRIREWVPPIRAHLWTTPQRTLLIGHGLGGLAVLRALSGLSEHHHVGGVVLVGTFWRLPAPAPALKPWMERSFDVMRARQSFSPGRGKVLLSDTDPNLPNVDEAKQTFEKSLGIPVEIVAGAGGFQRAEEPAVLGAVEQMCADEEQRRKWGFDSRSGR